MLLAEGVSTILNTEVVTFVIDAVTKVIGILTTPPLGIFLTIGLLGAVVGVTGTIVRMVKSR